MITKSCKNCNKEFKIFPCQENRKFCSYFCYWNSLIGKPSKSSTKFKKGWNNRFNRPNLKKRICPICKKIYQPKRIIQKHCSRKCSSNANIKRVKLTCKNCKKTFYKSPCFSHKIFCSQKCQYIYSVGKNHPSYKGGIKKDKDRRKSFECVNWRKAVFKRDNYTCQFCKIKGGYIVPHHIFPYSLFIKLRSEAWNGITLCKNCHSSIHKILPIKFFKNYLKTLNNFRL